MSSRRSPRLALAAASAFIACCLFLWAVSLVAATWIVSRYDLSTPKYYSVNNGSHGSHHLVELFSGHLGHAYISGNMPIDIYTTLGEFAENADRQEFGKWVKFSAAASDFDSEYQEILSYSTPWWIGGFYFNATVDRSKSLSEIRLSNGIAIDSRCRETPTDRSWGWGVVDAIGGVAPTGVRPLILLPVAATYTLLAFVSLVCLGRIAKRC